MKNAMTLVLAMAALMAAGGAATMTTSGLAFARAGSISPPAEHAGAAGRSVSVVRLARAGGGVRNHVRSTLHLRRSA